MVKPTVFGTAFERESGFKTENLIKYWIIQINKTSKIRFFANENAVKAKASRASPRCGSLQRCPKLPS